jgi:hypothetical protein
MWSGRLRRYDARKLDSSVQKLEPRIADRLAGLRDQSRRHRGPSRTTGYDHYVLLETPGEPQHLLWEGSLGVTDQRIVGRLRAADVVDASDEIEVAIKNLPVVGIGQPEWWPVADLYPAGKVPRFLSTKLKEADFFLIRLNCSFRPSRSRATIEWARFWIRLLPDADGRQPIAFDAYPREVTKEIERDVRLTFSPSFTFGQIGAAGGEAGFSLHYTQLEPVVTAAGVGESAVDWSYEVAHGSYVLGSKWMYLVVKAPKGMPSARVELDLVADVLTPRGVLPVALFARRDEETDKLITSLWG